MPLTPEDVVNKRFQPTKFREGYDQDEVDDFLDEIVVELRRLGQENEDLRQRLLASESRIAELQRSGAGLADQLNNPTAESALSPISVNAPSAFPEATQDPSTLDSNNTNNLLQLARKLHEEHVRDGLAKRDALIAEGHATAARVVREAEAQQRADMSRLEQEKASSTASKNCAASSANTASSSRPSSKVSWKTSSTQSQQPILVRLRQSSRMSTTLASAPSLRLLRTHSPVTLASLTKNPKQVRLFGFLVTAWLLIAIDQLAKFLAIEYLKPGQVVPVLGDLLKLVLVYNDSAAFSLGFGATWIFAITSSIATLVIIGLAPRLETMAWAITGGVALGGVVGNLVDRLFREPGFGVGHVVDFISIPFNFPIFNIADMAIVVVAVIVVIRVMQGAPLGRAKSKNS